MASHYNFLQVEGTLLRAPVVREDGHVEATLMNHEEWTDAARQLQTRENMLGIIALPGTKAAALLAASPAGRHLIVLGRLRTVQTHGPRGGTQTKTKIMIRKLLTEPRQ